MTRIHPNDKKCWIITKPDRENIVKEAFKGTAINVTVQGHRHLGAAIGSREYVEEYVNDKVANWISEITKLAEFAVTQPQASDLLLTMDFLIILSKKLINNEKSA